MTDIGRVHVGPEWALWPWQRCVAVTLDVYGKCRCDLKRGHVGPHRAERGMYDVLWPENTWTTTRYLTPRDSAPPRDDDHEPSKTVVSGSDAR